MRNCLSWLFERTRTPVANRTKGPAQIGGLSTMLQTNMQILLEPHSVADTGLRSNLLLDLALKVLYLSGELSLRQLAERTHLSLGVIEELFQVLRHEQLCEVKGMTGGLHCIETTSLGKQRAVELLSLNQYAGPAPVSLAEYVQRVKVQSVQGAEVHEEDVSRALEGLVLASDMRSRLGTAIVSASSIFLYGPTGTGKTSIAERIPDVFRDLVWIPYAVEVDNQIIAVYDATTHQRAEVPEHDETDRRWVLCRRPRVLAGGELTDAMLDLQFNPVAKYYAAPLQMKANNGVLIIDDFGRQRIRPEELLNRWIVPLDRGIDYLTLAGGRKFEIPFDLFVVFATNLNPSQLVDEAFLRRMQNKVKVDFVSRSEFREIFGRRCRQLGLEYEETLADRLIQVITEEFREPLRPCYAVDILRQICWRARYEGQDVQLSPSMIDRACRNYFLPPEAA